MFYSGVGILHSTIAPALKKYSNTGRNSTGVGMGGGLYGSTNKQ
jgi:hypothetical protein